tara:strand:+ start:1252 stop:2049 length:798 start_codon:yes stop_codon:yes gene_type:complete
MKSGVPELSLFGEDNDQIKLLKKVFERAGIIAEDFKNSNRNIDEGLSILIIKQNANLKKSESYLKEMSSGIKNGSLTHGFIWNPESKIKSSEKLESLISSHLSRKITYSRNPFVIRFVEDVIKSLENKLEKPSNFEEKNISIFYNVLDGEIGTETSNMLSDILEINEISVNSSDNTFNINDFSNFALEAKVIVVIFDQQKEWAEIFSQEIWKKIGGVSSGIPILLIGTESSQKIKIAIPNITIVEVAKNLLALEIKVQYDSLVKE